MTETLGATVVEPIITDRECEVHPSRHIPIPRRIWLYHVWPLAYGGPDIAENIVACCPTGAINTRLLLDEYIANRGMVLHSISRTYAFGERKLAKLGWQRIIRKAM